MSKNMVDFTSDVLHIGPISVDAIAMEVRPKCSVEILGVNLHHPAQGSQLAFSPFGRPGDAGLEVLAVTRYQSAEIKPAHTASYLPNHEIAKTYTFRLHEACQYLASSRSALPILGVEKYSPAKAQRRKENP
jgi:hypothetical protein